MVWLIDSSTLLLFILSLLALFMSPGPNMTFLLAQSFMHGPKGGMAIALGITLADLVLTALTALGVSALLMTQALFFDALRIAGAAYLLWLAVGAWRTPGLIRDLPSTQTEAFQRVKLIRMGMLNSTLNPKALLFFLVFLPQFVQAKAGQVPLQLLQLGLVLSLVSFFFHTALGAFSGYAKRWVSPHSHLQRFAPKGQALIFAVLALHLFWQQRPSALPLSY
jgi:threonine/homoserine/homoserine lactone efflux protein